MSNSNGRRKIYQRALRQSSCLFLLNEPTWGNPTPFRHRIAKPSDVLVRDTGFTEHLNTYVHDRDDASMVSHFDSLYGVPTLLWSHGMELRSEFPSLSAGWKLWEGVHFGQCCDPMEEVHACYFSPAPWIWGSFVFLLVLREMSLGDLWICYWPSQLGHSPS